VYVDVGVSVGVAVCVGVKLAVDEGVAVRVGVRVAVRVAVRLAVEDGVTVLVAVGELVAVGTGATALSSFPHPLAPMHPAATQTAIAIVLGQFIGPHLSEPGAKSRPRGRSRRGAFGYCPGQ
jgi:hypothetical protein